MYLTPSHSAKDLRSVGRFRRLRDFLSSSSAKCTLAMFLSATSLRAQTLSQLAAGVTIRITASDGLLHEGQLIQQSVDSIVLKRDGLFGKRESVQRSTVAFAERREPNYPLSIIAGSLLCAAVNGGVAAASSSGSNQKGASSVGTQALIGAGVGAILGVVLPSIHNWRPIPIT